MKILIGKKILHMYFQMSLKLNLTTGHQSTEQLNWVRNNFYLIYFEGANFESLNCFIISFKIKKSKKKFQLFLTESSSCCWAGTKGHTSTQYRSTPTKQRIPIPSILQSFWGKWHFSEIFWNLSGPSQIWKRIFQQKLGPPAPLIFILIP